MSSKENMICAVEKKFAQKRVLVIGDLMVDEYVTGNVRRISPEAPVPVLNFKEKRLEAGGASNVANNIKTLGCDVFVVGTAAEDDAGKWLRMHLKEQKMHIDGIYEEEKRPTIVKTRFATKGQQLLRMDNEVTGCITEEIQEKIISYLKGNVDELDAVVLSDYKKGVLESSAFVTEIIRRAPARRPGRMCGRASFRDDTRKNNRYGCADLAYLHLRGRIVAGMASIALSIHQRQRKHKSECEQMYEKRFRTHGCKTVQKLIQ